MDIIAAGTADKRILIRMNPAYEGQSWGALCFSNTTNTTRMNYVTIEDASSGPLPTWEVAAISAFKSTLVLDHMVLEKINFDPIAGRYSNITLTNSSLHSEVTGNLINVKYGWERSKIVISGVTDVLMPMQLITIMLTMAVSFAIAGFMI